MNIETTKNPNDALVFSHAGANDYANFLLQQEESDYFQAVFVNEVGDYVVARYNKDEWDGYVSAGPAPARPVPVQKTVTVWE